MFTRSMIPLQRKEIIFYLLNIFAQSTLSRRHFPALERSKRLCNPVATVCTIIYLHKSASQESLTFIKPATFGLKIPEEVENTWFHTHFKALGLLKMLSWQWSRAETAVRRAQSPASITFTRQVSTLTFNLSSSALSGIWGAVWDLLPS